MESDRTGTRKAIPAVEGDGSDAVRIQEADELDIANFHPPSGIHDYRVRVFFNNALQATTTFTTK